MAVYVLAQLTVHDRARYDRYAAQFVRTLAGFDGRLLVADESPMVVEGGWPHHKVVLIEFRDRDEYDRWATSPAYVAIAGDRIAATTGCVLLLSATAPPRSG